MTISIQHLETFVAVARNQSFSAAARELRITQPHVSNQVRSVEEHYRVPLFVRTKGRIALTDAGEALYVESQAVLVHLRDAERAMRDFRRLDRGSVRLAATSSVGNHLLPGLMATFRRQHPHLTVTARVDNTERVWEMVENDDAEVAITTPQPPSTRKLTVEPFFRDDLVLIAPTTLNLAEPLTMEALVTLPLVLREEGSLTLEVMRAVLGSTGVDVAVQLSGTAAVNEAVAAGAGISLVPESSVGAWSAAGSIRVHRLPGPQRRHDYVLVHATDRFQTAAASALLTYLRTWGRAHTLARPDPADPEPDLAHPDTEGSVS